MDVFSEPHIITVKCPAQAVYGVKKSLLWPMVLEVQIQDLGVPIAWMGSESQ